METLESTWIDKLDLSTWFSRVGLNQLVLWCSSWATIIWKKNVWKEKLIPCPTSLGEFYIPGLKNKSSYQFLVEVLSTCTLNQHLSFIQTELHPLPDFSFLLPSQRPLCNYVLNSWNKDEITCLIFNFFKTILLCFFPHPCLQRRGENIKCIHGKREYMSAQPLQPPSSLSGMWELVTECYNLCPQSMPWYLLYPCRISLLKMPVSLQLVSPCAFCSFPVLQVPASAHEVSAGCQGDWGNCFDVWYL